MLLLHFYKPYNAKRGKGALWHRRTVMVRISMRIRAAWCGQSLFLHIWFSIYWCCKRTMRALIGMPICADCFPVSILRKSISGRHRPVRSATLTGRWRPDVDLRRMLAGFGPALSTNYIRAFSMHCASYVIASYQLSYRFKYVPTCLICIYLAKSIVMCFTRIKNLYLLWKHSYSNI